MSQNFRRTIKASGPTLDNRNKRQGLRVRCADWFDDMKLQDHDNPADMRDKVIITVRHLKRTPKGFREQSSVSTEWRSEKTKAREEFVRAVKEVTSRESVFRALMFDTSTDTLTKVTGRKK